MTIGLVLEMKVSTPKKWKVNGKIRWVWDGVINGKRKREQFGSEKDCKAFIRSLGKDKESTAWWTDLTPTDRVDIIAAFNRAKEDGFSLLSAVESHSVNGRGKSYLKKMTLGEAVGDLGRKETKQFKVLKPRDPSGYLGAIVAKGMSKSGAYSVSCILYNLRDFIGSTKQVSSLTLDGIESFLNTGGIKKKDWSRLTKDGYSTVIHAFFNWCIRRDYIKDNPVSKLEKMNKQGYDKEILSIDECIKLLNFCYQNHSEVLPLLVFNLFLGIRPAECKRLRQKDVRWKDNEVVLPAKQTKTQRRRFVTISENARAWLELVEFELPLINAKGKWYDFIQDAKKLLNYKNWPHDCLRHSYCSYGLRYHEDSAKISLQAGNTESVMHRHYIRMVEKDDAKDFWNIYPKDLLKKAA